MKVRSVIPMQVAKTGYILLSALFAAAGALMIAFPQQALRGLGAFFGVAMLLFGAIKLIGYFSRDLYRLAFQYDLQFGILLLLLGLILLLRPKAALNLLCIAIGICLILDALFKCRTAIEARSFGIQKWYVIYILALISVLAGILLIFRADAAAQAAVILLGFAVLASSALNLFAALLMVKIVDHQIPDEYPCEQRRLHFHAIFKSGR